ncbi:MAG TPA: ABC transporter substrate-binding protein [Candidatus Binatia bacterium]|nr:ABC transporter substrate-binding protein [Candidatus Binatia bacterium]
MSQLARILISLVCCFPWAAGASAAEAPGSAAEPVKIGVIYNLSGAQSTVDRPSLRGAQLALKQLNAAGGILGRRIELIAYDGKTDVDTVRQQAEKLVTADQVVALIGLSDTDMVLAAAPVAARAEKVFLTSGATSPRLPQQVPEYLFLACFGDNVQAAAGAEYAFATLRAQTAYVLFDSNMEYAQLLAHYFKTRFVELGGEIVLEDSYEGKNPNLTPHLRKFAALARQPDLLYVAAGPEDAGRIVKLIRDAGITTPIMGGDSYDTPLLLRLAGEDADNTYYTTHAVLDAESREKQVQDFIAAYKTEYSVPPETAFAGLGYDAVLLLADAIKRAGTDTPRAIPQALQDTKNWQGVTGSITFGRDSRIPQKTVSLVGVKGHRLTLAATVLPQHVPPP